jgi:hypothetical protein
MARFPVNTGDPQLGGITSPTIWSGKLLVKFYEASVIPAISNTEYEGDIKDFGDQVNIRSTPDITISNYVKHGTLAVQKPLPAITLLEINKGKYWNFIADDVDYKQSNYAFVDDWTRDASEQVKISVDTDILAAINSDASADNVNDTAGVRSGSINMGKTGTPVTLSKSNVLDYLVDAGTVLDEQDVPESDRWMVLPPWACGLIKQSDLRDASLSGDNTSILRNGRLGMIDRFTLYNSNLLETVTDGANTVTNILFGHKSALTFAGQFVKNENLRAESHFGTLYRGLKVYGYKVIKPEALGVLYAKK